MLSTPAIIDILDMPCSALTESAIAACGRTSNFGVLLNFIDLDDEHREFSTLAVSKSLEHSCTCTGWGRRIKRAVQEAAAVLLPHTAATRGTRGAYAALATRDVDDEVKRDKLDAN